MAYSIKKELKDALENLSGENIDGSFKSVGELLHAFNCKCACVVTFSITPGTATVVVKDAAGNTVTADVGGTYTLKEGTYKYSLAAEDYLSETNVTLTISQSDVTTGTKTVSKSMTRVNCVVTFSATPNTASIVVKKDSETQAPDSYGKYHLTAGSYTYTASAEGYTTQSDVSLTIAASDVTTGTKTETVTLTEVTA